MVRIDDDTMSLQRETDVVHVTAAAGEELPIFDARQSLAKFCTAHRYGMVDRLDGDLDELGAVGDSSTDLPLSGSRSVDHLLTWREA